MTGRSRRGELIVVVRSSSIRTGHTQTDLTSALTVDVILFQGTKPMIQSKTDKIRERLEEADECDKHLALESVVEECEIFEGEVSGGGLADELLDLIAQELDVEEG